MSDPHGGSSPPSDTHPYVMDLENNDDAGCYACGLEEDDSIHLDGHGWPLLPRDVADMRADPYDEDGYCDYCGNGRWKFHSPECSWADAVDALTSLLRQEP